MAGHRRICAHRTQGTCARADGILEFSCGTGQAPIIKGFVWCCEPIVACAARYVVTAGVRDHPMRTILTGCLRSLACFRRIFAWHASRAGSGAIRPLIFSRNAGSTSTIPCIPHIAAAVRRSRASWQRKGIGVRAIDTRCLGDLRSVRRVLAPSALQACR